MEKARADDHIARKIVALHTKAGPTQRQLAQLVGTITSYVRTREGHEVDSLAGSASGETELIQVSADLDEPATRECETRALLAAAVEYPGAGLHLIALTPESAQGLPADVTVHPAARWFLSGKAAGADA